MGIGAQIRRFTATITLMLGVAAITGCRGQLSESPPIHLNPNMDQQERFDPQEPNELFADGRAMRPPVAGTVHHGWLFEDDAINELFYEGTIDGQVANTLPQVDGLELDDDLLQRGQDRYNIYCTPCHGLAGEGNGIVTTLGMLPPPSFHEERLISEPLGHLFRVITHGVTGGEPGELGPDGRPTMPPYDSQVPPHDRWAIAAYIRALQVMTLAGTDLGPVEEEPLQSGEEGE